MGKASAEQQHPAVLGRVAKYEQRGGVSDFRGIPWDRYSCASLVPPNEVTRPVGFVGRPDKYQPNIAEISHRTPCPSR